MKKWFIHMSAWAIILYFIQLDFHLRPNQFDAFLEEEMTEIGPNLMDQMRSIEDQKIETIQTPPIGCFSIYTQPAISITDFGGGAKEPIRSDVIYEFKDAVGFAESQFSLEGKTLRTKNGVAHFERVFKKPGIYPLKASISARKMLSDSLCTWEKTFYLKVQE